MKLTGLVLISVAGLLGFSVAWTGLDFTVPDEQPAGLAINEIILRTDGTAVYDREVLIDGAFYAWSAQIFNADGSQHCQGGATWRYPASLPKRTDRTVDWLVGADCSPLTADMQFLFTYTAINGDMAPVSFPPVGLGVVVAPDG